MKRNIIWSLILHLLVIIGGSQLAPMGGFATTSPNSFDVINVGIVSSPTKGQEPPAKIPELKPPTPAVDAAIAMKPTSDLTKEDVTPAKEPEPEKPKPKAEEKPKEQPKEAQKPAADSAKLAQAGKEGTTGSITEGTGSGDDVWGQEDVANVNPYHRQGFASIRNNWRNPAVGPRALKCIVRFKVERSGAIEDIALEQSSGSPLFDRAAIRAIKVTESWEPFPKFWEENEQVIHLEFEYRP